MTPVLERNALALQVIFSHSAKLCMLLVYKSMIGFDSSKHSVASLNKEIYSTLVMYNPEMPMIYFSPISPILVLSVAI